MGQRQRVVVQLALCFLTFGALLQAGVLAGDNPCAAGPPVDTVSCCRMTRSSTKKLLIPFLSPEPGRMLPQAHAGGRYDHDGLLQEVRRADEETAPDGWHSQGLCK